VLASERTREALVTAGKRAGLHRVELLEEPVAAALSAELEIGAALESVTRLGVYDLGGQVFSFSILERIESAPLTDADVAPAVSAGWAVLGARRQSLLGSEQFDDAIVRWLVRGFEEEHGLDLSADYLALQRLYEAAESAKLELSSSGGVAAISLPFITADASGPKHLDAALSRAKLESLLQPTLAQTTAACDEALRDAAVRASDLDAVLLIGGSARSSAVEEHVASQFGRRPIRISRPEEAVALGAAVHAQRLQAQQYGGG